MLKFVSRYIVPAGEADDVGEILQGHVLYICERSETHHAHLQVDLTSAAVTVSVGTNSDRDYKADVAARASQRFQKITPLAHRFSLVLSWNPRESTTMCPLKSIYILKYIQYIHIQYIVLVTHESSRGAWGKRCRNLNFIFTLGDAIILLYYRVLHV